MTGSTGSQRVVRPLRKIPTGIKGLDEITGGGIPAGASTLICGPAGCGKTLLAMGLLLHGAADRGEPGVFVSFEETHEELTTNFGSLGYDLEALIADGMLRIDHIKIDRGEIAEAGVFDLEALFLRLGYAIDSIGAKYVALDTIETLFSALPNPAVIRAELRRLILWLKDRGTTAVITAEQGLGSLTRHGVEEYVSDCVILLDHRVTDQVSTRRLRVLKYRGSAHGTNEYPFLIDQNGIAVMPVTSLELDHDAPTGLISSGIEELDVMTGGPGFYRGSTILISGTAGCGKTTVAAHLADATCRRDERCLFFLYEESPRQLMRNMGSVGLDLEHWTEKGLLTFQAARPSLLGLEMHPVTLFQRIEELQPHVVILDPMSGFFDPQRDAVKMMMIRLVDFIKSRGITLLLVNLNQGGAPSESTDAEISSLVDTWLLLRHLEADGERNRLLYVLKSRGMANSNQVREMIIGDGGVTLKEVYLGPNGVLTGSARVAQEERESLECQLREEELEREGAALERRRELMERKISMLREEFAAEELNLRTLLSTQSLTKSRTGEARQTMATSRGVVLPELSPSKGTGG